MKCLHRFLTLFLVSLLLRYAIARVNAIVINEFDPTSDYRVHAVPNSEPRIEGDLELKDVSKKNLKSDQNINNKLTNHSNEVGIFNDENPSTKNEQQSSDASNNEDFLLNDFNSALTETNNIRSSASTNDGCVGEHNSAKSYTVSSAARLLTSMLKVGPNQLYSQFRCDDPADPYIPLKAQEIYKKSVTWSPTNDDYLQCVAFVFMSYEMAGKPIIKQGRTNAADFLAPKYTGKNGQFIKFESGKSTQLPQEDDILVWSTSAAGTIYGHVGIVVEVRTDLADSQPQKKFGTILVANANAAQVVYEYRYTINVETHVVTLGKLANNWARVPDYWLRMKE